MKRIVSIFGDTLTMKQNFNTIEEYATYCRDKYTQLWQERIDDLTEQMEHQLARKGIVHEKFRKMYEEKIEYAKEQLANVERYVQKQMLLYRKPIVKKDNYTIYNGKTGKDISGYGGYDFDSRIRVPKLKRKTAWKRFYKIYPDLKGLTSIYGKSNTCGLSSMGLDGNLNDSTIKLK